MCDVIYVFFFAAACPYDPYDFLLNFEKLLWPFVICVFILVFQIWCWKISDTILKQHKPNKKNALYSKYKIYIFLNLIL